MWKRVRQEVNERSWNDDVLIGKNRHFFLEFIQKDVSTTLIKSLPTRNIIYHPLATIDYFNDTPTYMSARYSSH